MSATPTAPSWWASRRPISSTIRAIRWPASRCSGAWKKGAFALGGGTYDAPGQLMGDFVKGRASTALGAVIPSLKPAVHLTDLATSLPDYAIVALKEAFPAFDKQIKGYYQEDALLTGVETRTSSPVRIKRRDDDLQSLNTRGLFPAGEGAGYAGGILSARGRWHQGGRSGGAVDGGGAAAQRLSGWPGTVAIRLAAAGRSTFV